MNILIITNVWTGAKSFFYEGKEISTGMPAFNNVFLRILVDDRVDRIHIFLWLTDKSDIIKIPEKYKHKVIPHPFYLRKKGVISFFILILTMIRTGVSIVKNDKVKRLIGFGSLAAITAIIGKLTFIPDFRRIFGTFLINEINYSKFKLFLKHPLEYLCFSLNGKGLLVTNDGTKGDIVFNKIGHQKLPFYFPLNGVNKEISVSSVKPNIDFPQEFMSYVARLDNWKRQHLLIEALGVLKNRGVIFPKTYIIGSAHDLDYVNRLKESIVHNELESDVIIIYGLPISEVHYILKKSMLTFSLYHTSNLGNVFIESLQLGTPIVAINDTGSLNLIDKNAFYELKTDDTLELVNAIEFLLNDINFRERMSYQAIQFANNAIKSWDERATYEINLMLN